MKQLIHADILLSPPEFSVLKGGYLAIEGDTIISISPKKPEGSFDQIHEWPNYLVIPGLYNMHTHTTMVLLRGVGSNLPLDRWLNEAIFPVEAKLVPEDISVGTRLAMMEMLASGTVSFTDMYDMPQVSLPEIEAAGMKANINRPILAFDPQEPYEKNFRVNESLAFFDQYHNAGSGRVKIDFGIHAEYTSLPKIVQRYGEDCKKRGAIMHLHLSETKLEHENCKLKYGKTPARWFYDLGVFDNPTVAAHCVMVEPNDMELLREKGVTAVHNPSSNMKLGSGYMPLTKMQQKKVHLAIGTDGTASNNNLNMLEEIHLASLIHKGYHQDPTIVQPTELLQMATAEGARAQGRADCGEIAVGKKADLVAINLDAPHMMPMLDPHALLVYSAQGSDVAVTMVDGKILYQNGEFLTMDAEKVKYDVKKSVERLYG